MLYHAPIINNKRYESSTITIYFLTSTFLPLSFNIIYFMKFQNTIILFKYTMFNEIQKQVIKRM